MVLVQADSTQATTGTLQAPFKFRRDCDADDDRSTRLQAVRVQHCKNGAGRVDNFDDNVLKEERDKLVRYLRAVACPRSSILRSTARVDPITSIDEQGREVKKVQPDQGAFPGKPRW